MPFPHVGTTLHTHHLITSSRQLEPPAALPTNANLSYSNFLPEELASNDTDFHLNTEAEYLGGLLQDTGFDQMTFHSFAAWEIELGMPIAPPITTNGNDSGYSDGSLTPEAPRSDPQFQICYTNKGVPNGNYATESSRRETMRYQTQGLPHHHPAAPSRQGQMYHEARTNGQSGSGSEQEDRQRWRQKDVDEWESEFDMRYTTKIQRNRAAEYEYELINNWLDTELHNMHYVAGGRLQAAYAAQAAGAMRHL